MATTRTRKPPAAPAIQPIDRSEEAALVEQIIANKAEAEAAPVTDNFQRTAKTVPDIYFTESEVNALLTHLKPELLAARLAKAWRLATPLNADEAAALKAAAEAYDAHLTTTDVKQASAAAKIIAGAVTKLRIVYGVTCEVKL